MLQFITCNDSAATVTEQVEKALVGGCVWIQLSAKGIDGGSLKRIAESVMPACKDADAFLTIEHDVALVEDLKVHGVHLYPGDMLPREAREALGPHAVVGVTVKSAEEVINLRGADIDYVQIGPFPEVSADDYRLIVSAIDDAGVKIPIVATGDIRPEDVPVLLSAGVKGVGVSAPIADSGDIAAAVERYLSI